MKQTQIARLLSLLVLVSLVLAACGGAAPTSAPVEKEPAAVETEAVPEEPVEEPTEVVVEEPTEVVTEEPVEEETESTAEEEAPSGGEMENLGTPENPIIMALAPSATSQELLASGEAIAQQLSEITGYTIETTVPTSYGALVEAMGAGNAHIGWLAPFSYVVASERGFADVALSTVRFGRDHYPTQFIANVDSGFTPYFDPDTGESTADAATALAQFADKKPCWTDPLSSSGYVIPSGILLENGIQTRAAAFVQGHPTVARALYSGGICDFGATHDGILTDANLLESLPDLTEKVVVIWRSDPVIPNDTVSFATSVPEEVRQKIVDALLQISETEEGKEALNAVYQIEGLQVVDDTFYDEFRVFLEASGVDLTTLVP